MRYEYAYLDLMQDILDNGEKRKDRTGTGTISLFGPQIEFDISDSFPLITTKKVYVRGIIYELLWFLSGNTNTKYLVDNNVHIWDEWADKNGNLGPIYGHQWRNFGHIPVDNYQRGHERVSNDEIKGVDQIKLVIDQIRNNPDSRRIIVSAWNPKDIPDMSLPPCHIMFQFYVRNNEYLDCKMYQRSADYFLGVPFNIASYALLTYMIANVTGLKPGKYIHTFGDAHLYLNHIEQAELQLRRSPHPFPNLYINKETDNIEDIKFEDINIYNYLPHPTIKAEISV